MGLGPSAGQFGVDIFFVISGFVISTVAQHERSDFLLRRLIRIVPFYWLTTISVAIVHNLWPAPFRLPPPDTVAIACSLTFLPCGGDAPVLPGGWTLNYEMYFYALFAAALGLAPRRPAVWCSAVIGGVLLLRMAGLQGFPVRFYGNGIVAEFLFGIALHRWLPVRAIDVPPALLMVIGTLAFGALTLLPPYVTDRGLRPIAVGLPGATVVAVAILLDRKGKRVTGSVVRTVADASYVLYLTHPYAIRVANFMLGAIGGPLVPPWNFLIAAALTIVAVVSSIVLDKWIDTPIRGILGRILLAPQRPSQG